MPLPATDRPRPQFKDLLYALKLVWNAHRGLSLALALLTLVLALTPAATAWLGKLIIDAVVQAISSPQQGLQQLGFLLVLALLLAVFSQLLVKLAQTNREVLGDLLIKDINLMVIKKAIALDLSYYESPAYYDMLQRARQEASYRPLMTLQQLFTILSSAVTLVSLVALLLRFSPLIVLVLALTGLPTLFIQANMGQQRFHIQNKQTTGQRRLMYLGLLLTSKQHIKEIKLFNLARLFLARYTNLFDQINKEKKRFYLVRAMWEMGLEFIALIGYYGMYFWIAVSTVNQQITLGDMTMYATIIMQVQGKTAELLNGLAGLYEQNLFLGNLSKYLQLTPHLSGNGHARIRLPLRQGVRIQHLSFKYPASDQWALRHINLSIEPGEKIALVGENGAGKTTLIKLLTRLYDPDEGSITLDGVDLRHYDLECLHSHIGVIFQDYVHYHLSARENIGFGQVEALEDHQRIVQAAQKSGAHEFLSALPAGYDTHLGRWFEDVGTDLSTGQWQKVALARAYMRDAPILILDEPTSSLDAMAEYEIFKTFQNLAGNRTVILISHRFSTVRLADRIVVINQGAILEQGTHQQLLSRKGLYATMFDLQSRGYQ